jgi:hypothetical protein
MKLTHICGCPEARFKVIWSNTNGIQKLFLCTLCGGAWFHSVIFPAAWLPDDLHELHEREKALIAIER